MQVTHPDQLLVIGTDGRCHALRLHVGMKREALERHIIASGPWSKLHLKADRPQFAAYRQLLEELLPNSDFVCLPDDQPGTREVELHATCVVGEAYWRAIAKIAFHYYLSNSKRFYGHESAFSEIRRFIMKGGDRERFFQDESKFSVPYGPVNGGETVVPTHWQHLLVAAEYGGAIVAGVCLFMGPNFVAPMREVWLGRFRSAIQMPYASATRFSHSYVYFAAPKDNYAGRVAQGELFPARR